MSKEKFFSSRYFRGLPEDRQSLMKSMIKNASEIMVEKRKYNTLYTVKDGRRQRYVCL